MKKAEEILSEMTLEQKIAQLQCTMSLGDSIKSQQCPDGVGEAAIMPVFMSKEQLADAIEETTTEVAKNTKGVAPLMHVETLTGVSIAEATVFPSAIGLGATFDADTVRRAAEVIHDQAKAVGFHQALAPVLDVCRDPRWGRIGETYGEDPTLNALLGTAYVKALQGEDNDLLCATGKHFLGYGMSSGGINMASCVIPMREIREVYAKPFQAAITEGKMMSVMNSYGTIDGEMVIGSRKIMTDLLRDEMEFDGIVVSDYASIEHLADHRLAQDMADAGRQALQAGLDVECPQPVGYSTNYLVEAVKNGAIKEEVIDRSVLRVLEVKEKMGLLEKVSPDRSRMASFAASESFERSYQTAQKSIVLLKNDGILPLKKEKQKIAVIGPHADNIRLLFGCYTYAAGTDMMIGGTLADQAGMEASVEDMAGAMELKKNVEMYEGSMVEKDNPAAIQAVEASYPYTKTILKSIQEKVPEAEVVYAKGCDVAGFDRSGFAEALDIAGQADTIILTLGGKYGWGGSCTIGEGIDTDDIGLMGVQEELAVALLDTGKPVILVHMDGRPISSVKVVERANAILENWFPGTSGGLAIADVLFGDYNPAGRLSVTAPRSTGQIPIYNGQYTGNSYYSSKCPTSSCRYVDSTTEPLYYFGEGLSYTQFAYSDLEIKNPNVKPNETISISCKVKNIGEQAGEEVVQLYVSDLCASMLRPYQEFAGCSRIYLEPGEQKTVEFIVKADQFAFIGKDDEWRLEEGDMEVGIGGSSHELPLHGTFHIMNTTSIRPAKRGFYAKCRVE